MKIKIKRLDSSAKLPTYANPGDAGMDIYSNTDLFLMPHHRTLVPTGIAIAVPKKYVALVWDKSGLATKGIKTMAGVIDSGYRGEIKIALLNVSSKPYEIKKGEKVAQILIQPIVCGIIEEVKDLDKTERGKKGFGSSGLK